MPKTYTFPQKINTIIPYITNCKWKDLIFLTNTENSVTIIFNVYNKYANLIGGTELIVKKLLCLALTVIMLASLLVACNSNKTAVAFSDIDFRTVSDMSKVTTTTSKTDYVLLEVKDFGQILIRLYPDVAPKTVKNFKKLVSEGFYDGIIFHRIIEGFMIQGGDPEGTGMGGSDKNIVGEFNINGFRNNLSHVRGVVSMARTPVDMDSASSQFFICQDDHRASLDGKYASFGFVVNGMSVVDKIAAVDTSSSDKPYEDVVITSAKFAVVPDEVLSDTPEADIELKKPIELSPIDLDNAKILKANQVAVSQTPTDYACMEIADYGKVYLRLYPDVAPETVKNFKSLISQGFYNGLSIHRIVDGQFIQGGKSDDDTAIKGEFLSNGFENNISHTRGVISMARNGDGSDKTQFFICQGDLAERDGYYAAFGQVIWGMDIIDSLASIATDSMDRPAKNTKITSAYFVDIPKTALTESINSLDSVAITDKVTNLVLADIKDFGKIVIELYPESAPLTVENFQNLVAEGFYDGLIFHRVVENFVIQGGCPNGTGSGSSGTMITGEFAENGIENDLNHIYGTVSLARTQDFNSGSSQFFICHGESSSFDGKYAAFGYVVYGMDIIDDITKTKTDIDDKPVDDVVITSMKFVEIID